MKRLGIAFLITIILGGIIYLFVSIFKEEEKNTIKEEIYFDFSYGKEITLDELEQVLKKDFAVILMGNKENKATKTVSLLLKNIKSENKVNYYYLEKKDSFNNEEIYENFMLSYPSISNYMNFSPVILVFNNNSFIGGLPGEVKERNLTQFLEYTQVL